MEDGHAPQGQTTLHSVNAALAYLRDELAGVGARAEDLQHLIGVLIEQAPPDPPAMRRLQDADRLTQRIAALERFVAALLGAADPRWRLGTDWGATLKKLGGHPGSPAAWTDPVGEGGCELF